MRIEDYGLIGDVQSAALVGRGGTVDWLCLPRFDSPSCSAALLGDERHGRWRLAPVSDVPATSRRYRPGTLLLDPDFESPEGAVRVIDFMPRRGEGPPRLMRIVERMRGRVPMTMEFSLRPDYGSIVPWVELALDGVVATAGPDAFCLSTPLPLDVQDGTARAEFVAVEGARERLSLGWHPSHESPPPLEDADSGLARTEAWWRVWSERCTYRGRLSRRGAHLADRAQGHDVGDDRRDCRRADDLASGGHRRGAQLGLPILLAPRLGARARRAPRDRLLDVYGEVFGLAFSGVAALGRIDEGRWPRWRTVVEHVETIWRQPDDGIWETRGPRRRFMHSKVMAWVVFDRAVRVAEQYGLDAPLERWKQVRDEIHAEVCERGYDPERRTFTQYYGSKELDASVLNIPLVGFLPGIDEHVSGTIDAIARELGRDGFVSRYSTAETDDGLSGDEGQFLAFSFWLVSALAQAARVEEARALRAPPRLDERPRLAEEYDVKRGRQIGNFPQAFSHLTLIGAATAIAAAEGEAKAVAA